MRCKLDSTEDPKYPILRNTQGVWQFCGAYNKSSHVGCLAVAGSLIYRTVWSRSGRSSTRVIHITRANMCVLPRARDRARRPGAFSLACAAVCVCCFIVLNQYWGIITVPVSFLFRGSGCDTAVLWFIFFALYDAARSAGLLHKKYATALPPSSFSLPPQPRKPLSRSPDDGFWLVRLVTLVSSSIFFNFYASSHQSCRPSGPFLPVLPRESTPDPRKFSTLTLGPRFGR